MSIYLRLKRKKSTYFVQVQPSDTILEVKQKLQERTNKLPEEVQLLKKKSDGWGVIEDAVKLADAGIDNGEILALVVKTEDGSFESVDITPFEVEMAS